MKNCLCIFGLGYTASYLVQLLQNKELLIYGFSRHPESFGNEVKQFCHPLHFSLEELVSLKVKPTHLLISTPPTELGDPTMNEFRSYFAEHCKNIKSIGYLSATSVYGDYQGAWVDETAQPNNPSTTAKKRIAAEMAWLNFARQHEVPLSIFRIAGIYGPYRNPLAKLKMGKPYSILKENQVFSRIHVEDLAQVIKTALFTPEKADIYNVCDNEPASNIEVDEYGAALLGLQPPPHKLFEQAGLSGMALEFFQSNKRVSNQKIKEILGIKLAYPSYREGLTSLFKQGLY